MAEIYFSGQGIVYGSSRATDGSITTFRDFGNVPSLRLSLETDTLEHKESRTGQRLTDLRLTQERRANISMTVENFSKENLMMLLYGTSSTVSGATVTNEVFPNSPALAVGDMVSLAHTLIDPNAAFTIVDSAGSPLTLTNGTHYKVDKSGGIVTMLAVPGTQPYKATYTYLAEDVVPMFRQAPVERFLRFVGLNTANSDKPVIVELYRVIFDPAGNIDLINDEFAQFELEGSVLYDSTRDAVVSPILGGFGRIIQTP